jgi:stress response protein YsnF
MEERVEVRKVPHAVEEIEISKVQTQDTEVVSDTVRDDQVGRSSPRPGSTV